MFTLFLTVLMALVMPPWSVVLTNALQLNLLILFSRGIRNLRRKITRLSILMNMSLGVLALLRILQVLFLLLLLVSFLSIFPIILLRIPFD